MTTTVPIPTTLRTERMVKCYALLVRRDAAGGVHRRAVAVYAPEDLAANAALGEVLSPAEFTALVEETAQAFAKSELGKVYQDKEGGYRWITVHPGGSEEHGVPVKIRESKTEKGTWHVVGGAGGKLNYLRLTGVKSPAEYREQAQAKKKERDSKKQDTLEQHRARRETMTEDEVKAEQDGARRKAEVLETKRTEAHTKRQELVARVAEKLGWSEDEWQFDATRERLQKAGASAERIAKLEEQHHKQVYQRATDAIAATKRYLLSDTERAKLVLAGAPLATDDPTTVGLTDILEPAKAGTGKGFTSPTREKSDANLRADAGAQVIDTLREEYRAAAERQRLGGEDDPALTAAAEDARKQLHMAELLHEAATRPPAEVEHERTTLSGTLAATRQQMNDYLERLQELRTAQATAKEQGGDLGLTPEHAALEQRAYEDAARVAAMQDRVLDLAVVAGESVAPALAGEKAVVTASKQLVREAEIAREHGEGAVQQYRARRTLMEDARQRYLTEMRHYKEVGALKKPDLAVKPVLDAQDALELLAHVKGINALEKDIAKVAAAPDYDARMFGKGYFTDVGTPAPEMVEKAQRELEAGIEEKLTRAFLEKVESPELLVGRGGTFTDDMDAHTLHRALERHVSAGAYNAINNAALAALKAPVLTREVVDVLGAAGAAQLVAHTIRQHEDPAVVKRMAETVGEYHVSANVHEAEERLRELDEQLDKADEALAAVTNPSDVAIAVQANRERAKALEEARQTMGQALGEYEATAALGKALGGGPLEKLSTNLGPIAVDQAIRQMRSLGLARGDYDITSDGTNHFATIHPSGFSKLTQPVDGARVKLVDDIMAIKRGEKDEAGWTPKNTVVRPRSSFHEDGVEPASLTAGLQPLANLSGDVGAAVEEHIARRAANGEDANSILTDLHARVLEVPTAHRKAFAATLDRVFPLTQALEEKGKPVHVTGPDGTPVVDADGKPVPKMVPVKADAHEANVTTLVDAWLGKSGRSSTEAIHGQAIDPAHPDTHEAMVRALARDPRAMVAFKPLGDLSDQDQRALRHYFATAVAKIDPKTGANTATVDAGLAALGPEPTKTAKSLFGGEETTPEWLDWNRRRDAVMNGAHFEGDSPKTSSWQEYVHALGGLEPAYRALQDKLKGGFVREFHTHYTRLTGTPLRLGSRSIAHAELHGTYIDPAAREKHLAKRRELLEAARNRDTGGAYAAGGVVARMERMAQAEEIERQNQLGLLGGMGGTTAATKRGPGDTERYTLGTRAEAQLASLMPAVGQAFRPTEPVPLVPDGVYDGKFAYQQRIIKAFGRAKRLQVAAGTGTGKTKMAIGAAGHLMGQGKVKRALFLAPSAAAGQWAGEFVRWADPKAMRWTLDPGASREQRLAEHAAGDTNAVVHTHERFRDDMLHLLGQHWGTDTKGATARFMGLDRKAAADTMRAVWKQHGIDYDMLTVDEGHKLLDRDGKPDSVFSRVVRAASDATPYYMSATADPVKNDVSELRSLLSNLDPSGRYDDAGEWTRRYGVNTVAAAEALKREIAPWVYAYRSENPNKVQRRRETVPMSPWQQTQYQATLGAAEKLRVARLRGDVDVAAAKVLQPQAFANQPASAHEDIARRIQRNPNPDQALARIVDGAPAEHNAKLQYLLDDVKGRDAKKEPFIVFAHRLDAVDELHRALAATGIRVGKISGATPGPERDRIRQRFQGDSGNPELDALVLSDAAEAGLNLQRAKHNYQYDTPLTAKTSAQREGRNNRLGQQHDEIGLIDLATNSPYEARARQRLETKYALRDVMTDPATTIDDTGLAGAMTEARRRAINDRTQRRSAA